MESYKDIFLWLKSISKKSGLPERLSYKNVSLWRITEFQLLFAMIDVITNKRHESNYNILKKYIYRLPFLVILYFLVKSIAVFVLSKLLMRSQPVESSGIAKIMAVSYTFFWRSHPALEGRGKNENQDVILGDIITRLRTNRFNVVALYEDTGLLIDFKTVTEGPNAEKGLWKPIEAYLTFDIIRTAFRASRRYKKEWDKLKNNQEFMDSLVHEGMPLFGPLKAFLKTHFEQITFVQVLFIELMQRAVEMEKPDLILIAGERSIQGGEAALIAGKLKGIPTLAIQHGNINLHFPMYLHTKEETYSKIASEWNPLPDKTAVYGPQARRVLVEDCNYPETKVVVTGQPRYDILAEADRIFSREEFCQQYGLDLNRKIALICTECLPIFEENVMFLQSILRALREFPEMQIVIKPHPYEKGKWYERTAREERASALILPQKSNTYEAMYACDVMLAFFSTTITEALILSKPVVVVNLTGKPDPMPYVENCVAIGAYKQEDIAPATKDALYSKSVIRKLAQARKEFVYEHAYIQDGQATTRVAELIKQMLGV